MCERERERERKRERAFFNDCINFHSVAGVKGTLKLRVEWNELANIHQRLLSIK